MTYFGFSSFMAKIQTEHFVIATKLCVFFSLENCLKFMIFQNCLVAVLPRYQGFCNSGWWVRAPRWQIWPRVASFRVNWRHWRREASTWSLLRCVSRGVWCPSVLTEGVDSKPAVYSLSIVSWAHLYRWVREAIRRQNLLLFGFFQNGLDPPPCVFNRPGVVGAVLQSPPSLIN